MHGSICKQPSIKNFQYGETLNRCQNLINAVTLVTGPLTYFQTCAPGGGGGGESPQGPLFIVTYQLGIPIQISLSTFFFRNATISK